MFYNGLYQIGYRALICIFLTNLFIDFGGGLLWSNLNKIALNDSLYILYLLSSPVSTIWIFVVIGYFLIIFKRNPGISTHVVIIAFSLHLGIYFDSVSYVSNFFKLGLINTTLQNGLVNIHPIIIYYFYALLIILSVRLLNLTKIIFFFQNSTTNTYSYALLLLLGVILGAFWAAQELNWGGLWSWDPVEMLSILLALYLLKILHKPAQYLQKNYHILWIFITGLIIVMILRLGVLTTVHSFVKGNTMPAHVKLSMFAIIITCAFLLNVSVKRHTKSSALFYNLNGDTFYTICLVLIYSYILYLFASVTTHAWQYISFDISTLSCLLLILYSTHKLLNNVKIYVKIYIYTLPFIVSTCIWYNFTFIIVIIVAVFVGLDNRFIEKLRNSHKYIVITYLIYFCIVANLVLSLTPLKATFKSGVELSLGCIIEPISNYYESFVSLTKQSVTTKLKALINHIQGFSVSSNGFWTTFSFSKNQKMFCLFGVEYVCILFIYVFLIGLSGINYKLKTSMELTFY